MAVPEAPVDEYCDSPLRKHKVGMPLYRVVAPPTLYASLGKNLNQPKFCRLVTLGYDRGEEGGLVVNEEQAATVRRIYSMFLEGGTPHSIAKYLTEQGVLSPGGKKKWNPTTVKSILTNEKMKGDALLQKSYTVDFLTKKKKVNEGEIPQYYVENSHEAIIEPLVFEMVQHEMARRQKGKNRHSGVGLFSSRIKCGDCGSWYGSKVWHSTDKYRRTVWQCNHKFGGDKKCSTPHFDEDSLKRLFVSAVNKLLADKDEIVANFAEVREALFSTATLKAEAKGLQGELAVVTELIQRCIEENARVALDQKEYQERYEGLVRRFDTAKARYDEVQGLISDKKSRGKAMEAFIAELASQEGLISDFDERLWYSLVGFVTVYGENDARFTFKNGVEIRA
jgi:hypothetical protein